MNNDDSDTFDCGYHLYAKDKHKERVQKNPDRVVFAEKQFKDNNIEYYLKNIAIGHFHAYGKDGLMHQFWAGTGKILPNPKSAKRLPQGARGIHKFIEFLKRG